MHRSRIAALFAGIPLAFICSSPSFASSIPALSVDPPISTVTAGSGFTVDVNISNVTDLYDFQFDLTFDPEVLQASNVTEGTFLSDAGSTFFLPGLIDNVGGSISFNADTLLSAIPGASGSGTLAQFDFTALASGTSDLTISNEILQDSTGAIVTDTTASGTVTVLGTGGGGPMSPTPEIPSLFLISTGLVVSAAFGLRRAS
jgi:hypothetical protein